MPKYRVEFNTNIGVSVEIEADDAEAAADAAWDEAESYLSTLTGDGLHVVGADASLDGIGADAVKEV